MKKLFKWGKGYWGVLIAIVLLSALTTFSWSYMPQFIRYIFGPILKNEDPAKINLPPFLIAYFQQFTKPLQAVFFVSLAYVIFQTIRALIQYLLNCLRGITVSGIARNIRIATFDTLVNVPSSYHNDHDAGDIIQRCSTDVATTARFITYEPGIMLHFFISVGMGIYQMARINLTLVWVSLAVAPIALIASAFYFRYFNRKWEEAEKLEAAYLTAVQENVNGVRIVKAFANENYEEEKFNNATHDYAKVIKEIARSSGLYWGISDMVTSLQYMAVVLVGVHFARTGVMTTADIITALFYVGMMIFPFRSFGRSVSRFSLALVAARRIDELMSAPNEFLVNGTQTPPITGDIEFAGVGFNFGDNGQPLFKDVSFKIAAGETVAIVGRTGSGKTTIANLLTRLEEYTAGAIYLDGTELKQFEKHYLRRQVGLILQEPFLYNRSIRENIRVTNPAANDCTIEQAATLAAIDKDIKGFSEGYNTLVGEKGVTLSGGQKQRLTIARMLLVDKPIIIFDDSLSAVDTATDFAIRKALAGRGRRQTTIIITHRIATAQAADKIIVLEDGVAKAIGTHAELIARPGFYQEMWRIQGDLEAEFEQLILGACQ